MCTRRFQTLCRLFEEFYHCCWQPRNMSAKCSLRQNCDKVFILKIICYISGLQLANIHFLGDEIVDTCRT